MSPLREIIQDLATMSRRGTIADEELSRVLDCVIEGRGAYGWLDSKRARDLDLVALLELGGSARRSQALDHIEHRWGHRFTENDREMLPIAHEPRWRKACNWAFYNLSKEGLIKRPLRGVQSLTDAGKREAETRRDTWRGTSDQRACPAGHL